MIYYITFFLFIAEIILFCCGGIIFAYSPTRKISESLSLGIFLSLILISLVFQVAFLLEFPQVSVLLEVILAVLTLRYIIRNYPIIKQAISATIGFIIKHKLVAGIIIICWLYLFLLVAIIPPANWDSMAYNLSRVYLFQQANSLFLENVTTLRQSMFVVGADLLNYGFLRLDRDYGVGIFSWLAYISVGIGTYGLSRNFASERVSLATALIIISLPEFCFQATSTKNDIFTAASALFCFIIGDRFLAKPDAKHLGLLLLGLAYGFSAKTTFLAFLVPFGICFSLLAIVKVGGKNLYKIVINNWLYLSLLTAPILVISQVWLFWHNAATVDDLTGGETIKIARDSINLGVVANLVRYFFQSIHLFPLDYIAKGRLGIDLGEYLSNIYYQIFQPVFDDMAMGYVGDRPYLFKIRVIPHEDFSWYGPLALMVILPAICFSLFKGNYWLKVQSLSLLGFMLIFSHKLVWTPWSNRYVTLFFAASGTCVAFFLQQIPQKFQGKILQGIKASALIILISACVLNVSKPLGGLSITEFFKPNIWNKTNFGSDRLYYARKHHDDDRVEQFRDLVAPGSKVALIAGEKSWIYHFYLVSPGVEIIPTSLSQFLNNLKTYDYLLCLDTECDLSQLKKNSYTIVWQSATKLSKSGRLVKVLE